LLSIPIGPLQSFPSDNRDAVSRTPSTTKPRFLLPSLPGP
jgi:hypothetical protein